MSNSANSHIAATAASPIAAPLAAPSTCPWAPKKSKLETDSHISWEEPVPMMTPLPRDDDKDLTFTFDRHRENPDSGFDSEEEDVPLQRRRSAPFPASTETERTQFYMDDSVPTPGPQGRDWDAFPPSYGSVLGTPDVYDGPIPW